MNYSKHIPFYKREEIDLIDKQIKVIENKISKLKGISDEVLEQRKLFLNEIGILKIKINYIISDKLKPVAKVYTIPTK